MQYSVSNKEAKSHITFIGKKPYACANWNPWHGCVKISPGCKHCYVYRQDKQFGVVQSSNVRRNHDFDLPLRRRRDKSYKLQSGSVVFTCFTSDFLIEQADSWRQEAWEIIRLRSDLMFMFFTKGIDRFSVCVPPDWGRGYENVMIGCTVENQAMADFRLPIFKELPIRYKAIIAAPLLERLDISRYLDDSIVEVSVGGESGPQARVCDYAWVLDIRRQCVAKGVPFSFHQTGANLLKDGKLYRIERKFQHMQARKANINYRVGAEGYLLEP